MKKQGISQEKQKKENIKNMCEYTVMLVTLPAHGDGGG
jgi:hypothetical protein